MKVQSSLEDINYNEIPLEKPIEASFQILRGKQSKGNLRWRKKQGKKISKNKLLVIRKNMEGALVK